MPRQKKKAAVKARHAGQQQDNAAPSLANPNATAIRARLDTEAASGEWRSAYQLELKGAFMNVITTDDSGTYCAYSCGHARIVRQVRRTHAGELACVQQQDARRRLAKRLAVPGTAVPGGNDGPVRSESSPRGCLRAATVSAAALAALTDVHRGGGEALMRVHARTFVGAVLMRPIVCGGFIEVLLWDDFGSGMKLRAQLGAESGTMRLKL